MLDLVARKVVAAAIAGDMQAAKEIGDRVDGKAAQRVDLRRITSIRDLNDDELAALARDTVAAEDEDED